MLAPLLIVWPMSIAATYLVASSIANAPFDHALEDSVTVLAEHVKMEDGRARFDLPVSAHDLLREDGSDQVYYQVRGARGELVAGDADVPDPPVEEAAPLGLVQFRKGKIRGEPVRIAWLALDPRQAVGGAPIVVQVAETLGKRGQLASEIVKGVILPQFVILPVAVVLVWFGLSRGIRPLSRLQERIQARGPNDMRPIDPRQAPEEVAPLVMSFNQLLQRLERNLMHQKRFIADAAHQMRTPLAGLRTQAELALRLRDPGEIQRSLKQLATSSDRATRLINQLLSLARAENAVAARTGTAEVDLEETARDTVREWVPAALEKKIDLGFEGLGAPVMVPGDAVLLRELIKNLVDNAIRYTPENGSVTVAVGLDPTARSATLSVVDNGPGIPESERQMVFERFYRILGNGSDGSGLGLAIVREIAEQHHATIELSEADGAHSQRPGCAVYVTFPSLQSSMTRADS